MSATSRGDRDVDGVSDAPESRLFLNAFDTSENSVIRAAGELDLANSDELVTACTIGRHPAMVIDLGGITFLDCSGYGSLVGHVASSRAKAGR